MMQSNIIFGGNQESNLAGLDRGRISAGTDVEVPPPPTSLKLLSLESKRIRYDYPPIMPA